MKVDAARLILPSGGFGIAGAVTAAFMTALVASDNEEGLFDSGVIVQQSVFQPPTAP